MKILVTGSAGRVGRNIYIHLMRQYQVVGLDMTPCSTVDYIGDIRDPILIKSALKDVDVIVHAAALHAPHVGLRPDDDFIDINVRATEQLINMGIEQGISRFVYTSTTALYGYASTPQDKAGWVTEQVIPQPRTIYHQSKLQAERLLQRISEKNALPVTVLQMSRCFPEPADSMTIFRLNRGIDARDVASAHACAINSNTDGFRRYIISAKTPFCASDCGLLYSDADKVISKYLPELVAEFNLRGWVIPKKLDRVYDLSLAQKELGWEPRYDYKGVLALLDNNIAEVIPVTF